MNRRDIPNLLGKPVRTIKLKTESWNDKEGTVISWNEENQRFGVKLFFNQKTTDSIVKWFKPINLIYYAKPQNLWEENVFKYVLLNQLTDYKLTNFEEGIQLFDQLRSLEEEEKYSQTFMKIWWLRELGKIRASKDKRYLPKIKNILENIIQISKFDDLIVSAKLLLAGNMNGLMTKIHHNPTIVNMCLNCVGEHYGYLPKLFNQLAINIDLEYEIKNGKNEMFEILKDLYFQSKNMILKKTCVCGAEADFLQGADTILLFCKSFNPPGIISAEEVCFIRKRIELGLQNSAGEAYYYFLSRICFIEDKFQDCIHNIQIYQENVTKNAGNVDELVNCYMLKLDCYIMLKNKAMAKMTWKKLKTFKNIWDLDFILESRKNEIKKMSKLNNIAQKKKQTRTRTQCSSYDCKNVEPHVGAFKSCGNCRLNYYCSRKCQTQHWKNGHRQECQKI